MCGRARLGLSAPHICACRGGVYPRAQSDNTGPHGPALLPAGAAGNPAQTPVLQRVSSPRITVVSNGKKPMSFLYTYLLLVRVTLLRQVMHFTLLLFLLYFSTDMVLNLRFES